MKDYHGVIILCNLKHGSDSKTKSFKLILMGINTNRAPPKRQAIVLIHVSTNNVRCIIGRISLRGDMLNHKN